MRYDPTEPRQMVPGAPITTRYVGKTNIQWDIETCEHCGRDSELQSFDTTLFLTILLIPVVPLRKLHVHKYCGICTTHTRIPQKKWNAARDNAVDQAINAYASEPDSREKAWEAAATALYFGADDAFVTLYPVVESQFPRDAELLALLAVGHASHGRLAEAEQLYRQSLESKNDAGVAVKLAKLLMSMHRPADAHVLIQPLIDGGDAESLGTVLLLVEAYQAEGMHQQAIDLLDECASRFAHFADDSDYARYRQISQEYRSSGRRISSKKVDRLLARPLVAKSRSYRAARLVPVVLLAIAFIIYCIVAWRAGASRKVYLVNGLDRAYTVEIAGRIVEMPPRYAGPIIISEGDLRMRCLDSSMGIPEQTLRIRTPFFSRPFSDKTFVINPDKAALIFTEETVYSMNPSHRESTGKVYPAQVVHEMSQAEYAFEPLPLQLRLPARDAEVKKTLIGQLPFPPATRLETVVHHFGEAAAADYIETCLRADADDAYMLGALSTFMPPERAITLLRQRLGDRPVRLEWHRAYQLLMERDKPEHDLLGEYKQLLSRSENDASLLYLTGQVCRADRSEAHRFIKRAAEAEPPCSYAWVSLAVDELAVGRCDSALRRARRAVELDPNSITTRWVLCHCLDANGCFAEHAALHRSAVKHLDDLSVVHQHATEEILALACAGKHSAARSRIDDIARTMRQQRAPDQTITMMSSEYSAIIAYVQGDVDRSLDLLRPTGSQHYKLRAAIHAGKFGEASHVVAKERRDIGEPLLLLHVLAKKQPDVADKLLQDAIKELRTMGYDERKLAQWLAKEKTPTRDEVLECVLMPAEKTVALIALSNLYPEHRSAWLDLAKKLNFRREFPHHELKKLLGD